ncbi:hypothetical protein K438DRAFT_1857747 [Mycena galopus ATCC 62051]|nr:hypothetical protein K438DRAFT_1857747 [Mycena galopus ATCC 62051]
MCAFNLRELVVLTVYTRVMTGTQNEGEPNGEMSSMQGHSQWKKWNEDGSHYFQFPRLTPLIQPTPHVQSFSSDVRLFGLMLKAHHTTQTLQIRHCLRQQRFSVSYKW